MLIGSGWVFLFGFIIALLLVGGCVMVALVVAVSWLVWNVRGK